MRWRRAVVAIVAAAPAVALLGFGLTRDPGEIASPLPGRPAPPFALAAFSSGDARASADSAPVDSIRLADLRGRVVVVNFWASWCLACRDEHEALRAVSARYAARAPGEVQFLGVLYNDRVRNGLAWLREMGTVPYPSLEDPGSRTAIDYGLYGVPETFFIGPDGIVLYKHLGPVTERLLTEKIEQLRAAAKAPSAEGTP